MQLNRAGKGTRCATTIQSGEVARGTLITRFTLDTYTRSSRAALHDNKVIALWQHPTDNSEW